MTRLDPKARRDQILTAALSVSAEKGYESVTRADVADRAGTSEALINNYFGTMANLKRSVMKIAIKREHLRVIAQGLAAGDPHAGRTAADLKKRALTTLL